MRGRAGWGRGGPLTHSTIPSGAAGLVCAETLRQEGFSDRIVLCTLDRHLPYDRPKLSKVGGGANGSPGRSQTPSSLGTVRPSQRLACHPLGV